MENRIITLGLGMVKAFLIKGQNSNILVDTGIPGQAELLVEEMKKNGVMPTDISLIIITHNHSDHVGNLAILKELSGAKVAIHRSEAEGLRAGRSTEVKPARLLGAILTTFFRTPKFEAVKPDILLKDELDLGSYGIDGKVIHTPGHTPGSVSIFIEDGQVIAGDLFDTKKKGNRMKATYPVFLTSRQELKESLKKLISLSATIFYTSHGETCTRDEVEDLLVKIK